MQNQWVMRAPFQPSRESYQCTVGRRRRVCGQDLEKYASVDAGDEAQLRIVL